MWRHPAEVALDARRSAARRRARRVRSGATLVGSAIAVSGLWWISGAGPTEVEVATERVRPAAAGERDVTTQSVDAAGILFTFDQPSPGSAEDGGSGGSTVIVVRSAEDHATLAGAVGVRDRYVVTSGAALAGAESVVVTWGDSVETGTVIGRDDVTDLAVIQVEGPVPNGERADAQARQGDEVNMAAEDGSRLVHRVVAEQSTSAMANGDPVVGIVELDGRIGDVPPGSPAYDVNGDIVGIATATADSAPAAIVPIELARKVADEIIDTGEATHPWLGITARNPDDDDPDRAGSLVTAVTADGPAAAGGMIAGDLITVIDGQRVDSMASMVATLRSHEPGDVVEVIVLRDGGEVRCSVELASHLDV